LGPNAEKLDICRDLVSTAGQFVVGIEILEGNILVCFELQER
jgi:hypothetical protein